MKVKDLIEFLKKLDKEADIYVPIAKGDVYYDSVYDCAVECMNDQGSVIYEEHFSSKEDFLDAVEVTGVVIR